ncbi:Indoleamine 2,3-dioxygenase [Rhizoctonia solani]|uniref:Indoleamine 2,3-dioxygenase n=1 Tax=Rhizoctonia solani TaxID=456999 RepID=A0A8H7I1Y6_9AGAM|nr:Indoleamine 2,3-dioxygenase [Rhizoctonia solani]
MSNSSSRWTNASPLPDGQQRSINAPRAEPRQTPAQFSTAPFSPIIAMALTLAPSHFLDLPHHVQPGPVLDGVLPDTSTVAAHDFDVDVNTGFMPNEGPLLRIPREVSVDMQTWEDLLSEGLSLKMKLGDQLSQFGPEEAIKKSLPVLDPAPLMTDTLLLRPPIPSELTPHVVPACIAVPLCRISSELGITPILTYADNVLWNWHLPGGQPHELPTERRVRSHALFSASRVSALSVMRSTLDELFIGDATAVRRISSYLHRLSSIIDELTHLLLDVREGCDPAIFYHQVRPWFRGATSDKRGWVFEGVDAEQAAKVPALSGPSAGQSSLVHALDIFLGVDHERGEGRGAEPTFLTKMERYMPYHHRAFLQNLRRPQRHLREFVISTHAAYTVHALSDRAMPDFATSSMGLAPRASIFQTAAVGESGIKAATELRSAYDSAVEALKRFRDGHIKIATLYIVNQARSAAQTSTSIAPELNTKGELTTDGIKAPEEQALSRS